MQADLTARVARVTELAQRAGVSPVALRAYLELTQLDAEVQRRVLAGDAQGFTLQQLRRVARRPPAQQLAAFETLRAQTGATRRGRRLRLGQPSGDPGPGVSVRVVVNFNPEAFIAARTAALETQRELDAFIADLNRRLRSPSSRRTAASIAAEVDRFLRARQWVDLFHVTLAGEATGNYQVTLQRDEEAWARRSRYDGFSLFAAHPDLPLSAADLVATYFAKDAVEKDFQTIKSELELRPIRHRTDLKVRAHVTLCMLALLLERQLEQRLHAAGVPMTATSLFDALSAVHLNILRLGSRTTHLVTERDPDAAALLTALGLQHLVDDALVAQRIQPRAAPLA
jgi:DNA-binding transcriptional MerR regulator